MIPAAAVLIALLLAGALHLAVDADAGAARLLALAFGAEPQNFAEAQAFYAALPRVILAMLVGAALGTAGSLMQQITRNPLVSPLTLGAASGAWLATVIATLAAPALLAAHGAWVSLAGAIIAVGLVIAITGIRGLVGVQAVLAGMAVNLLFGAVASAVLLLNSPYFGHLFLWGAGDLAQTDWHWVAWLWPRLLPALAVALLAARGLALLRLGAAGAEGRGLTLWPFLALTALAALALTAFSVTAVGMIGFVGLIAPNIARRVGARLPMAEVAASAVLGALVLTLTDALAVLATQHARDLVPSGATTALIGAPALIWLARRRMAAEDHTMFRLPGTRPRPPHHLGLALLGALALAAVAALCVSPGAGGWRIGLPDPMIWSFRWPRVLAAAAAGAGMAVSGVILQRLIRNPLASPDILGMSSGASFAMIGFTVIAGGSIHEAGLGLALLGSFAVLLALLWLGRRQGNAPAVIALVGISLGALFDALVKLALASGTDDAFAILGWLGGSTYRVTAPNALILTVLVAVLSLAALGLGRWLTLLAAGEGVARGRGLDPARANPVAMVVAAALAAVVTAFMGPVSFVGLLAPHVAALLGARQVGPQLGAAALTGALLLVLSDWAGRTLLFPMQLPAGTVAALIGGFYFLALLLRARARPNT
ncbi:Fe(3+)-hydroxamate ABC transporter permease FhuB [Tranquillimonas alkanivorans]|uniref:Iron complex transport system permease protein n=1 Tax=Tranquillimonas alkanivorans TaxID=441119 RepID=A0A1I5TIJ8_9RHOB|nr:Fe(3+)-hydroxamate ABC transporter permease FhuB [Tranquillimonas alkanivorans]SFP82206.1 iron complex transport system permease protein [Tranquillimonas alkanivorans]